MVFKERIEIHRSKLEQNIDVEKLYPLLQQYKAINADDITLIEALPTKPSRVGKLLDILLAKDSAALQSFYLALQKMYEHILTEMFIEPHFPASRDVQESFSTSLTSDSEDDGIRGRTTSEARHADFAQRPKVMKVNPSHQYDPNSTSGSFPTFSEHLSPVSVGGGPDYHSPVMPSPDMSKHSAQDQGYGWFFKQFECAFNELKVLKQQNAEMMGMRERYDQVSKEAEHLRGMYKSKCQLLQQTTADFRSMKTKQGELLLEKTQLLDEIAGLQKLRAEDKIELSELRHQQRKAVTEENANNGMAEMYAAALDKYENMRKDFDVLREQYAELVASRSSAISRIETLSEENSNFAIQLDEMRTKNEMLSQERNGLKQQCTNAIREWNQTLIKHGQIKEKLTLVIKQRDDFCKDFNHTFAKHAELKKINESLRAEKDAAVKEYALVMSERDTVHKEIEQLQDKLNSENKRAEILSKEKKDIEHALETIRQDMNAVLSERDKYRRERNDVNGINQGLKHERLEFQMRIEQQRDIARKERKEAYEQMEHIIKETQKEKADEIDSVTKETETLKKQIEKLNIDFENAEQEAENANKNRDKAFSERDKIVQERESIRTLCDNLRRDRDRAVSDLAQALRDSDEFKRQKNEAVKELKEIKGRYEAMVEKDTRRHQLHYIGHNHSRDSAIDADLQDLGAETAEIPIEMDISESGELGFEVLGGKDDPQFPNDPSVIVSHVMKGGPAEGKLRVNDTILKINGLDTVNVEKRSALQALRKNSGVINLFIKRRKSTGARIWQPVQIVLSCQKDPGIQIGQGLYITQVCPSGVVTKYGVLPCVGDRIININNISVEGLNPSKAMKILESATDCLVLDVWRQASPFSSAGSSPTPTSTGINSPLPDGIVVSSSMSKSDTLAIRSSSWETPSDASRSAGSSKNLRSSGSQTDSLDSPGPSPRKALRNQEPPDKVRHSLLMLDKAKEKVEKIFKSRNKSQEREKESDEKKDNDHSTNYTGSKGQLKGVEDCGTQVNFLSSGGRGDAVDYSNNSFSNVRNGNGCNEEPLPQENRSSKANRKRDFEFDINSGTWPKTRNPQCPTAVEPPSYMFATSHKPSKERPSIKDVFNNSPDSNSSSRTLTSGTGVHHSAQNSDSSIKYPSHGFPSDTQSSSSAFSPMSHSNAQQPPPIPHPVNNPVMSLAMSSPSSSSILSSSKSPSHFSVGIMHGPSLVASNLHPLTQGRGPAMMNKHGPAQIYGTMPSHKHPNSYKGSLMSSNQAHVQPSSVGPKNSAIPPELRFETGPNAHTQRGYSKVQQMKQRRPGPGPHRIEKHIQPPPVNWPPNRITSESPISHSHAPPNLLHTHRSNGASPNAVLSTYPNTMGGASSPYGNGVSPQGLSHSPQAWGVRPTSLDIPQSIKLSSELVTDLPDRHRITSPVNQSLGSGIVNRPHQHYHPSISTLTSSSSPSNQHPNLSSPPGTFPVIRPVDLELERPSSFHGPPTDRYSSPSLSQKSCSTLERFTPTIIEEPHAFRYQRASPHSRTFLDDESRSAAYSKRDKVFDRIRIPSSTSVNTKSGSVEIVSDRSSPGSPMFHIENRGSLKYKGSSPNSDEYIYRRNRPSHHETRDITFEKSSRQYGFKIQKGPSGGIFVSSVNSNSLAAQAGLVIGDQLLEVCGINMRNANYDHAVTVLRQCGDNLTIKVQYNPEKYTDCQDVSSSTSINSSSLALSPIHSMTSASEKSTPKHQPSPSRAMSQGSSSSEIGQICRRFITLKKSDPNMLGAGFSFVGGNAVGIFIHEIYHDCFIEGSHQLQRGDHILEFNTVDFRSLTAEKAMVELNRPCANIELCVIQNMSKYNKIQGMPCDSFYIRANFDRVSETEDELSFHKEDVLYVENSLYKNQLGTWYAWLVDDNGTRLRGGIIPSRIRLEDELVLRRTHSESWSLHDADELKGSRRGSASARRSFFRRKRHHRNNSKDSHEFGSYSDASLNSDSVPVLDDSIYGYTRVEKIESKAVRPVVLLAPLAEALIRKLISESPDKYGYCEPVLMRTSAATMEQSLLEGVLIDYWKDGDAYHCVRASDVKEICDKKLHCLLNVTPSAIDRMHQAKVYPITIFVRHKSAKQIRDVRDPQFLKDRASSKLAKEQFEQFQKIEQDNHHIFSGIIQGGNLAEMCMRIKDFIMTEQKKALWITTSCI